MLITLMTETGYSSLSLPEKISGQYGIKSDFDNFKDELKIEGINGKWQLKLNREISVLDDKIKVRTIELSENEIYTLHNNKTNEQLCVYTENDTEDRQCFEKMIVNKRCARFLIGRDAANDIVVNSKFVSGSHAELIYNDGQWSMQDLHSTNGTFVNQKRINNTGLNIGDVVFLMGLKIIIGKDFIAFNNPDGNITVNSGNLLVFKSQEIKQHGIDEFEAYDTEYFYRSPRFKRDIEQAKFKVDSPPQNNSNDEMPLMMVIGPSMTMGMASMATAAFSINNAMANGNISSAIPSIVMSFSMLLGTVMWPILTKRYEKKRKIRKEEKRQKLYREYLEKLSTEFDKEASKQAEILCENNIHIKECIERIENVDRKLWERGIGQDDFLDLRLGLGDIKLNAEVSYSERRFTVENDNLQEELYALCETPKIVQDVPITLSFFKDYITGIIGDRNLVKSFVEGLIFQLSALYGYDEVKLAFIYDESESDEFDFVKWLPHVWDDEHKFRFVATNKGEIKEVSSYFEKIIDNRVGISENDMEDITPYYVIFALNKELAVKADMLKKLYSHKKNIHMSIITCFDELKNVPKECTAVIELSKDDLQNNCIGKIFDKDDISGQRITFTPDIFADYDKRLLSTGLSNVLLDTTSGGFNLPNMVTFLEMYGVGKVEHLNALTRWKENDPTKTLEAAVGIDTLGDQFKLDLHEKFHGPHGLVAGMTGSGKSEFIITYILSLAVNYHPYEVVFILIDYKGGGMAKAFENLPHTAGIITNLDGAAVKRSLTSIESELKRRQAIFAKVSKDVGVSNIDIYKYQKLYREGKVSEPLQHLFIISDEFAELKTQQPEFMAQLVSAARIGRSLGVHLILATQKPSGVVDDQIWSNSKFRVCLKVQERSDSMDMLKRPDAAELSQTGRFYLQVGYNELFELGQSAWAGAAYYPNDRVVVEKDDSVDVIDKNGRIIKQAKLDKRKNMFASQAKQLDEITKYLKEIADEEKIHIRPLWLEPIPGNIYLDEIRNKYSAKKSEQFVLNPVIGVYDDPAGQSQELLYLPISTNGNAIIYGAPGSGKTTFLTTMIYSLINDHTPDEVNIYVLDFAAETLTAFSKAPHIGDVILSYEDEKISNLFKLLQKEIACRKKIFADYGGDYKSYIEGSADKIPSIIVAVNNFAAFTEVYEEKEEAVRYLSREGVKYGIYFVLTAIGTNAVRFKLLQNFNQQIVLQLNDEMDYATIVGKTDGLYPAKYKGRGLVKTDDVYEFQTASVCKESNQFKFVKAECERLSDEWNGKTAKRIPILPELVDKEFLSGYTSQNADKVPIGVENQTLEVFKYSFIDKYVSFILSSNNGHIDFTYEIAELMCDEIGYDVTFIDSLQSNVKSVSTLNVIYQKNEIEAEINNLFNIVLERNNAYKEAIEKGEEIPKFNQKVYIINSLAMLKGMFAGEIKEKLDLILEKGETAYAVTIIVAESVKNVTGMTFEKWYKKHISSMDCIWIGNGIAEQYQFKANKTTAEMHDDIGDRFGFALVNGKPTKIKILNSQGEE